MIHNHEVEVIATVRIMRMMETCLLGTEIALAREHVHSGALIFVVHYEGVRSCRVAQTTEISMNPNLSNPISWRTIDSLATICAQISDITL